jgi:hypothetical protein
MAVVYRVRHVDLGTVHALKVIKVDDDHLRERLLQEGRAQGRIRHPAVLAVTDLVDVSGSPGLVLEYVEGGRTLADLLRAGRVSDAEARRLGRTLIEGVAAAHAAGLVHRDLKPSNVLLHDVDGIEQPKLADFGLAKALADETSGLTGSGLSMGTPAYMAPEQAKDSRSVDHRADLWSLGAVLYELVTGQRAFGGASIPEVIAAVIQGRFDPVSPSVPMEFRAVIESCLVVPVETRAQTAEALLALWTGDSLRKVAATVPVASPYDPTLVRLDSGEHPSLDELLGGYAEDHLLACPTCRLDLSLHRATARSVPAKRPSPKVWALVGLLAGLPVGFGALSVTFGSLREIAITGPVGPTTIVLFVLGTAIAGGLAAEQRVGKSRPTLVWLTVPMLAAAVGLAGAVFGMNVAADLVHQLPAETRAAATLMSTQVALTAALAGWLLAALGSMAVTLTVATVRPPSAEPDRSRQPLVPVGLALAGGTAAWMLDVVAGTDRPSVFLLFAALATAGGALSLLEQWRHPALERGRATAWAGAALGVMCAGSAVHLQDMRRLAIVAMDGTPSEMVASGARLVERLGLPPWWAAAWAGAVGLCILGSAWKRPVPRIIDVLGPLAIAVALMAATIPARAVQERLTLNIGQALETLALDEALGGLRIEPSEVGADRSVHGIGTVVVPGQSGLVEGDRIFAWNGQPLDTATDWAAQLAAVRCTDAAQEGCLALGATLRLTVLRGDPARLVETDSVLR